MARKSAKQEVPFLLLDNPDVETEEVDAPIVTTLAEALSSLVLGQEEVVLLSYDKSNRDPWTQIQEQMREHRRLAKGNESILFSPLEQLITDPENGLYQVRELLQSMYGTGWRLRPTFCFQQEPAHLLLTKNLGIHIGLSREAHFHYYRGSSKDAPLHKRVLSSLKRVTAQEIQKNPNNASIYLNRAGGTLVRADERETLGTRAHVRNYDPSKHLLLTTIQLLIERQEDVERKGIWLDFTPDSWNHIELLSQIKLPHIGRSLREADTFAATYHTYDVLLNSNGHLNLMYLRLENLFEADEDDRRELPSFHLDKYIETKDNKPKHRADRRGHLEDFLVLRDKRVMGRSTSAKDQEQNEPLPGFWHEWPSFVRAQSWFSPERAPHAASMYRRWIMPFPDWEPLRLSLYLKFNDPKAIQKEVDSIVEQRNQEHKTEYATFLQREGQAVVIERAIANTLGQWKAQLAWLWPLREQEMENNTIRQTYEENMYYFPKEAERLQAQRKKQLTNVPLTREAVSVDEEEQKRESKHEAPAEVEESGEDRKHVEDIQPSPMVPTSGRKKKPSSSSRRSASRSPEPTRRSSSQSPPSSAPPPRPSSSGLNPSLPPKTIPTLERIQMPNVFAPDSALNRMLVVLEAERAYLLSAS